MMSDYEGVGFFSGSKFNDGLIIDTLNYVRSYVV